MVSPIIRPLPSPSGPLAALLRPHHHGTPQGARAPLLGALQVKNLAHLIDRRRDEGRLERRDQGARSRKGALIAMPHAQCSASRGQIPAASAQAQPG
ncbi:hypothetical protein [uncultured Thiocystis sp.]|uniref:hypothetical protein n=1 Tax=uncultured Thiocystis sp. TaxID=1202134 RepID=UPI0025EB5209|nr:hypothetical protein [uncultured Thiocystis sp.]